MSSPSTFDPVATLAHLARGGRGRALLHTHTVPGRLAQDVAFPEWVDPSVYAAITGSGVRSLWSHQAEMAGTLRSGKHAVLATGTASGKSLGYLVPVLSSLMEGTTAPTGRGSTALYLAPTKALAGDQEARLAALALPEVRCATYDGDTPSDERRWIRDHAHYVLTNPDLLH
ncbi:MAG: DEAD/DEAH box helicase, partial [Ornithinimicrobium sp.]